MASENDPTITIEYYDGSWKSVLAYAKRFETRDAGILKIPTASIVLNNKAGRWTDGVNKIPDCAPLKITADVRGVVDTIFQGYYLRSEGDFTRRKHDVTIKGKGYGVKLLWDTITYPYHQDDLNRGIWTMKDVVEDFLAIPDSGHDTDITLVTDSGDILTERPVDDFDRESLFDALRSIAEKLNYDGYVYDVPPSLKLNFKAVGTVQTDPAITLAHPFISVKPIRDTEEIRNFILPWGDIDIGDPPSMDRWTEDYDRWANLWTAGSGCTVVDSATQKRVGTRSIKITNTLNNPLDATLDISVDPDYDYVDCSTRRFFSLNLALFNDADPMGTIWPTIDLYDDAGTPNIIRRGRAAAPFSAYWRLTPKKWMDWGNAPVGPDLNIWDTASEGHKNKEWFYTQGSTFSWKITKVRIWAQYKTITDLYVDGLYFRGGVDINPLMYPSFYPECPVKNDASITLHQRRVKHIEDHEVRTFAQATLAGLRELAALKDPIQKVTAKKGAKTWAKPHQYLTFNLPEYEIDSEYWRILEIQHDWKAKGNILRTTFTLVPQSAKVSTTAIQIDDLAGVLRSLKK